MTSKFNHWEKLETILSELKRISVNSPDPRKKVGAVIMDLRDYSIQEPQFNSRPEEDPNFEECVSETGCSDTALIHAEEKCLLKFKESHEEAENFAVVVTHCACKRCASRIFFSGIRTIFYDGDHDNGEGAEYFESLGGSVIRFNQFCK